MQRRNSAHRRCSPARLASPQQAWAPPEGRQRLLAHVRPSARRTSPHWPHGTSCVPCSSPRISVVPGAARSGWSSRRGPGHASAADGAACCEGEADKKRQIRRPGAHEGDASARPRGQSGAQRPSQCVITGAVVEAVHPATRRPQLLDHADAPRARAPARTQPRPGGDESVCDWRLTTLLDPRLNSPHDIGRQFLEDCVGVQPGCAHKPRPVNVALAARVAAPHARVVRRLGGQMEALVDRGGVAQWTINCLIGHKIPCKRSQTGVESVL